MLRGVLLKEDGVLWPITEDGCETAASLAPAAPTHTTYHTHTQVESVTFLQQDKLLSGLPLYVENIGPVLSPELEGLCGVSRRIHTYKHYS